ncbi:MAG: nitroreductase family deazaflavin-dependent oxidoreductase, partial [Acidimicrobiia bacterium]|nr:nitroreductase family deazaflavin-dependent oxidoreductase [Acidimicrobiia bacterium]
EATMRNEIFRLLKLPPRMLYAIGLGAVYGRVVLLLTTRGRRTGRSRITPLQYEQVSGAFVVASARGERADWYRNVVANPRVEVRVRRSRFSGIAETCTDPVRIADFLELRLERHPRMVGRILRLRGVPAHPTRTQLESYTSGVGMVTIAPL